MAYVVKFTNNPPHFLGGTLVDFSERLTSPGQRAEVARVFKDGTRLLQSSEIPQHLRLREPAKKINDIFQSHNSVLVVSHALRELLEEMDPGVHQFSPITLDYIPAAGSRFVLNVHFKQDSIVDKKSDVRRNAGASDNSLMQINFSPEGADLTIDASRLSSENLWRERRYPGSLFVSERLCREMENRSINFFTLIKIKQL